MCTESTESARIRAEVKAEIAAELKRLKEPALRRLAKLMNSEAASIDGRLDEARERLIKWAEQNSGRTHHLTWIDMENAIEEAAEELAA